MNEPAQKQSAGRGIVPLSFLLLVAAASLARAEKPLMLTFDDLAFEIEQDQPYDPSMLTDQIKQYEGRAVYTKGFLSPSFKQSGLTDFVLMRNTECRFASGDPVCHFIMVELQPGYSIEYTLRPVAVQGRMHLEEYKIGKRVVAVYHLLDALPEGAVAQPPSREDERKDEGEAFSGGGSRISWLVIAGVPTAAVALLALLVVPPLLWSSRRSD